MTALQWKAFELIMRALFILIRRVPIHGDIWMESREIVVDLERDYITFLKRGSKPAKTSPREP